jgi:hypothetical protein
MVVKMSTRFSPSVWNAMMHAQAMSAAIRLYSMAVAPLASVKRGNARMTGPNLIEEDSAGAAIESGGFRAVKASVEPSRARTLEPVIDRVRCVCAAIRANDRKEEHRR